MSNIIFRMAAWTDAAGKFNPDAPLDGNEDNYYADDDLGDDTPSHIVADEELPLSDCGMIMSVSDGMGGMNAGEVASQIAHDTVAEYFAPGKITPQLAATHKSRSRYMEEVIREADRRIKAESRSNSEHEGMGATLIMAWLSCGELSVTWIGDSRAYRFNPVIGIEPLSKDHTYVQELADQGVITYEQTFDHPQNNVVTRSLGDSSQKANPESRLYKVYDGDIILLCSDGLSGVLRDRNMCDENGEPYPEANIEDIIREHSSSLKECREALWAAAEQADWYDNVTAILCEIRSGAGKFVPAESGTQPYIASHPLRKNILNSTFDGIVIKIPRKRFFYAILLIIIVAVAIGGAYWYNKIRTVPSEVITIQDTLKHEEVSDTSGTIKTKTTISEENTALSVHKGDTGSRKKQNANQTRITPAKSKERTVTIKGLLKATEHKDSLTKIKSDDNLNPVKSAK